VGHPSPNARYLNDALDDKPITLETAASTATQAFDLASTSSPFIKLKTFDLQIRCDQPTFGIMAQECSILDHACISGMVPNSTGADLRGW
jgi:hypothetical protein